MKSLNIRKKLVSLAVASAVSGGAMMAMTAPAHAMNVSQDNLGQVLLFPYYTVKNGFDTLFTVTNTSDRTAVMKIRWREALNSREVRDFNVILSPYDVWTGVVTSTADGTGALVRTFDKSCTSPLLPAGPNGSTQVAFTNALYTGKYADGASESMDRLKEGYFEVYLMGVSTRGTGNSNNTLEYNAKHVNGVPRDCSKVDPLFLDVATINGYMSAPENILKGHTTLIDVVNGKAIDAEPTAIENFQTEDSIVFAPGNLEPDLTNGNDVGETLRLVNGVYSNNLYVGSHNGVSDLLRASNVINEYATGSNAFSSWVVTFPSKHHYTDAYTDAGSVASTSIAAVVGDGFSDWFFTKNSSGAVIDGKSCDNVNFSTTNREEGRQSSGTGFSPSIGDSDALCYEVNVLDFNNTSVFGSGINHSNLVTAPGAAGWVDMSFTEAQATSMGGLPVIGFAAIVRDSGNALANYGSASEHAYKRPAVVGE